MNSASEKTHYDLSDLALPRLFLLSHTGPLNAAAPAYSLPQHYSDLSLGPRKLCQPIG